MHGLNDTPEHGMHKPGWKGPKDHGPDSSPVPPPDYLNDRNAIHAAMLTLNDKEQAVFGDALNDKVAAFTDDYYTGWAAVSTAFADAIFQIASASTGQLCYAFLVAKGIRL